MKNEKNYSRRGFLRAAAVTGALTVAGCGGINPLQDGSGDGGPGGTAPPGGTANGEQTGGTPVVEPATPPPTVSSAYNSIQRAIDMVSNSERDVLTIDEEHVVSEPIRLRSDLHIDGTGGVIRSAENTNTDLIRPENVSNVWIDGLTIDGNYPDSGEGVRCLGGVNVGDIRNLRVTNCTIKNAGLHGIELQEKEGNTIEDVYIGDNLIENSRSHGILIGQKEGSTMHSILVEGNTVVRNVEGQAIGLYGQGSQYTENVAIIGNDVRRGNDTSGRGTNLALEENVRNSIVYGNTIDGYAGGKNGISVTKNTKWNIVANNSIDGSTRGLACLNFEFFEPNGPPRFNVFVNNAITNASSGFEYRRLDGDIAVGDNRVTNCERTISDGGHNSGDDYLFYNNGPDVSRAEVPDEPETGAVYTAPDDAILGGMNWSRGSFAPDDRVQIDVRCVLTPGQCRFS